MSKKKSAKRLTDLMGKSKRKKAPKKATAPVRKPKAKKLDDLLGKVVKVKSAARGLDKLRVAKKLDDLLGPKKRSASVADLLGKRKYEPLKAPRAPDPAGIFALREGAADGLGVACLGCGAKLKRGKGRPPVICRKQACFRAYRNAYRRDYDKARAS